MPKRSFDFDAMDATRNPMMPADKVQRKTERSHEENQERAYVAASRRADRSIEARVQSARMASEIHKKRTGKSFKITEQIVMKEEMYEEEDDELPRSFRLLGPHMQTASPEMNMRVEAYLSNRFAMSALLASTNAEWRQNEINKLFDQSFPNASRQARQLSQHLPQQIYHGQPSLEAMPQSPVVAPNFQPVDYHHSGPHHHGRHSLPSISPSDFNHCDEPLSPIAATPGSCSDASRIRTCHSSCSTITPSTPVELGSSSSAFTTELPPEAKMLMGGMGMHDTYSQGFYDSQNWANAGMYYNASDMSAPIKEDPPQHAYTPEFYDRNVSPSPMKLDPLTQNSNAFDESWDVFINDNAWGNEQ